MCGTLRCPKQSVPVTPNNKTRGPQKRIAQTQVPSHKVALECEEKNSSTPDHAIITTPPGSPIRTSDSSEVATSEPNFTSTHQHQKLPGTPPKFGSATSTPDKIVDASFPSPLPVECQHHTEENSSPLYDRPHRDRSLSREHRKPKSPSHGSRGRYAPRSSSLRKEHRRNSRERRHRRHRSISYHETTHKNFSSIGRERGEKRRKYRSPPYNETTPRNFSSIDRERGEKRRKYRSPPSDELRRKRRHRASPHREWYSRRSPIRSSGEKQERSRPYWARR